MSDTNLIDIYKIVLEEYRFQVNLNWDRNKFYLLLNSGILTATCGLLRLPGFKFAEFLTLPLFILGILIAGLGLQTLLKGIEYRRRLILKKAELERKLAENLNFTAIETTAGMRELSEQIIDREAIANFINRPPRIGTISYFLAIVFILLMGVNIIALSYLIYLYLT